MSDEAEEKDLNQFINEAVSAWMAQQGGGMVVASWFIVDYLDGDGKQAWAYVTADGQKVITSMGLLDWSQGICQFEMNQHFGESPPG